MCGIVGYLGYRKAFPIVINGLQRLEYRGYDSAGVVLTDGKKLNVYKTKGKVADLRDIIANKTVEGNLALGHTRWATHGVPNMLIHIHTFLILVIW